MVISKNLKLYGGPLVSFETTTLNFNLSLKLNLKSKLNFYLKLNFSLNFNLSLKLNSKLKLKNFEFKAAVNIVFIPV